MSFSFQEKWLICQAFLAFSKFSKLYDPPRYHLYPQNIMKRTTSPCPPKDDGYPSKRVAKSPGKVQASLERPISPPPLRRRGRPSTPPPAGILNSQCAKTSAIEAGVIKIDDHLSFFSAKLKQATRPPSDLPPATPLLAHSSWIDLYKRNQHPHGRHFVIHQHDHPVAGTHYDLRLQISETSSVSWAIMYGLPGDVNSRRLNRNATETRVHCLWVGLKPALIEPADLRPC